MKKNPTNETMIKAMKTNNATTAYFIIEKPRLRIQPHKIPGSTNRHLEFKKTLYFCDHICGLGNTL